MRTAVCAFDDLTPGRGVCALVGEEHVAIFRLEDGSLCAVSNVDPFSGASVLSRGIVGTASRGGGAGWIRYVASPLRKQRFDLHTGVCLDDERVSVAVHEVDVIDGRVVVGTLRTADGRTTAGRTADASGPSWRYPHETHS